MKSAQQQHEPSGVFSRENKTKVFVRADKYFVCSSCGVLVEIPADVVGQLVLAVDPSPQNQPTKQPPASDPPPQEERTPCENPRSERPSRPPRPKPLARQQFSGKLIDGLRVPTGKEVDRALAWISFHQKVLDRQGSEINRLKKLLKSRCPNQAPCSRSKTNKADRHQPPCGAAGTDAHSAINMAPGHRPECSNQTHERGPP